VSPARREGAGRRHPAVAIGTGSGFDEHHRGSATISTTNRAGGGRYLGGAGGSATTGGSNAQPGDDVDAFARPARRRHGGGAFSLMAAAYGASRDAPPVAISPRRQWAANCGVF